LSVAANIIDKYVPMKNKSADILLRQFKELEEKVMILSRQIETLSTAISASGVNTNSPI
jgi:hypothetical protein